MDPLLTNDERKMREEMLQHEFPFDEKAWASMEALLEREKQKPVAGLPPKSMDAMPGPGRKWGLLLALVFAISLGAASLLWWNSKQAMNERIYSTRAKPASTESTSSIPISAAKHLESIVQPPTEENDGASAPLVPKANNRVPFNAQPLVRTAENTNQSVGSNPIQLPQDQTDIVEVPYANPATITPDDKQIWDLSNLVITPSLAISTTKAGLNLDSLIHPLKLEPAALRRWERGWILGMNANTVDNNPLRFSVLPHLGHFWSYRFRPGTVLQADLVLKYVTGYQLHIETTDITPAGTSYNTLNTNNLLYLELPLLVKRQFKPEQSWLLGIKPSGNVKLFSTGVYSSFNDSGNRHYGSQAGIRYFDLGIVLGWEWRYHKYWALDIRYNQGLFDLSFDQFYRDNSTHLNSDLQVSLRYSMGKKIRRHAPKTLFTAPAGQ